MPRSRCEGKNWCGNGGCLRVAIARWVYAYAPRPKIHSARGFMFVSAFNATVGTMFLVLVFGFMFSEPSISQKTPPCFGSRTALCLLAPLQPRLPSIRGAGDCAISPPSFFEVAKLGIAICFIPSRCAIYLLPVVTRAGNPCPVREGPKLGA